MYFGELNVTCLAVIIQEQVAVFFLFSYQKRSVILVVVYYNIVQ